MSASERQTSTSADMNRLVASLDLDDNSGSANSSNSSGMREGSNPGSSGPTNLSTTWHDDIALETSQSKTFHSNIESEGGPRVSVTEVDDESSDSDSSECGWDDKYVDEEEGSNDPDGEFGATLTRCSSINSALNELDPTRWGDSDSDSDSDQCKNFEDEEGELSQEVQTSLLQYRERKLEKERVMRTLRDLYEQEFHSQVTTEEPPTTCSEAYNSIVRYKIAQDRLMTASRGTGDRATLFRLHPELRANVRGRSVKESNDGWRLRELRYGE
jgi:uncharacterized protein YodC (DUF2158 family)